MSDEVRVILIDPGVSRLKGVAQGRGKPMFFSMSPYCAEIDEAEAAHQKRMHSGLVSDTAWVQDPDGYFLLGEAARDYQGAVVGKNERKYKKALYQVLGMLGYYAQELGIRNRDRLAVGIVLPYNEYATKDEFAAWVKIAIQQFDYCGKTLGFELDDLAIRPEGAGLYLSGLPREISAKTSRVASLIIGFRNASWLVNENGRNVAAESQTCNLGYRWLIERLMERSGHSDELRIAHEIFTGGDSEICQMASDLVPIYWRQLQGWIASQKAVDHIVLGGGTSLALRSQIEASLPHAVWPDALLRDINKTVADPYAALRYADGYGVFKSMVKRLAGVGS